MLENFPVKEVREIVEAKSRIKPHPILPNEFYHKFESHYPLDTDLVNFAYFGSFYVDQKSRRLSTMPGTP